MPPATKPAAPAAERKALGLAIKRLRKRADLTQETAAEAAGVVVQSWRRYEWGERELSVEKLERIARAIRSSREELLAVQADILATGHHDKVTPLPLRSSAELAQAQAQPFVSLPIRDRVQAGAWLQADDVAQVPPREWPAARDPRYPHARQWLSEVVGDSVNRLNIFEGDLVHCVDALDTSYFPRTNDIVEVERLRFDGRERELTIKQVEVTPTGVLLWPRSTNPMWKNPVSLDDGLTEGEEAEVRIRALVIASIRRF